MGHINIEIPDRIHDKLREEKELHNVPIKMVVIESLRRDFGERNTNVQFSSDQD